jgi:hypothetical protein
VTRPPTVNTAVDNLAVTMKSVTADCSRIVLQYNSFSCLK